MMMSILSVGNYQTFYQLLFWTCNSKASYTFGWINSVKKAQWEQVVRCKGKYHNVLVNNFWIVWLLQRPALLGCKVEYKIADLVYNNGTLLRFGIFLDAPDARVRLQDYLQRNNDRRKYITKICVLAFKPLSRQNNCDNSCIHHIQFCFIV